MNKRQITIGITMLLTITVLVAACGQTIQSPNDSQQNTNPETSQNTYSGGDSNNPDKSVNETDTTEPDDNGMPDLTTKEPNFPQLEIIDTEENGDDNLQLIEETTPKLELAEKNTIPEFDTKTQLIAAFAEKYDKPMSEIELNISQETENYAKGTVSFFPHSIGNSGYFLAAKIDGKWTLAFDGNGSYDCNEMLEYNFPEDMIPGCY